MKMIAIAALAVGISICGCEPSKAGQHSQGFNPFAFFLGPSVFPQYSGMGNGLNAYAPQYGKASGKIVNNNSPVIAINGTVNQTLVVEQINSQGSFNTQE